MSFPALTAPSTLAEAFFRLQWTSLSVRARTGDWYPRDYFDPSHKLLREDKVPLLAAAVREVFYVYGERCAWECVAHPYVDWQGKAFVGWSYEGRVGEPGKGNGEGEGEEAREVWRGIRERAREVGLSVKTVELEGTGLAAFARERELSEEVEGSRRVKRDVSFWVDGKEWRGQVSMGAGSGSGLGGGREVGGDWCEM